MGYRMRCARMYRSASERTACYILRQPLWLSHDAALFFGLTEMGRQEGQGRERRTSIVFVDGACLLCSRVMCWSLAYVHRHPQQTSKRRRVPPLALSKVAAAAASSASALLGRTENELKKNSFVFSSYGSVCTWCDVSLFSTCVSSRGDETPDIVPDANVPEQVVFIESICNDEVLVQRNIAAIHQSSPEYKHEEKSAREVEREVRSRIELYQKIYQVIVVRCCCCCCICCSRCCCLCCCCYCYCCCGRRCVPSWCSLFCGNAAAVFSLTRDAVAAAAAGRRRRA